MALNKLRKGAENAVRRVGRLFSPKAGEEKAEEGTASFQTFYLCNGCMSNIEVCLGTFALRTNVRAPRTILYTHRARFALFNK